jgi:hypothetical protein
MSETQKPIDQFVMPEHRSDTVVEVDAQPSIESQDIERVMTPVEFMGVGESLMAYRELTLEESNQSNRANYGLAA